MRYAPFALAEQLEVALGDPHAPTTAFAFAQSVALDASEAFPEAICAELDRWGMPHYYVPRCYGGKLVDFEQTLQLMRLVARRDLTVAVGHGKTFLGSVCAWVSGDSPVTRLLATRVTAGEVVAWGLTEREHGSDLLAGDLCAEPADGGYRLSGEKWLINNATRGNLVSVLARIDDTGGPRGFDMLLVDKSSLHGTAFQCLPKEHTHGIRGADISGIAFNQAWVPGWARIGAARSGIELVLKGLQLTRTLCAALSLGAGDHALRLALRFASERQRHGFPLIEMPHARRLLLDAYADHLLADAVTLIGVRSIQALPAEMSLTSAVVKYLVPTRTERMIDSLSTLLGARAFLADVFAHGMFQKIWRDHRIVSLFDGNTVVNLNAIVNEFPLLARAYAVAEGAKHDPEPIAKLFDWSAPLPDFAPGALNLVSRKGSSVMHGVSGHVQQLQRQATRHPALEPLCRLAQRLLDCIAALHAQIQAHTPTRARVPAKSFEWARRYCLCYAGATVLGLWLFAPKDDAESDDETASIWRNGYWARAALTRVLAGLGEVVEPDDEADRHLFAAMLYQHRSHRLFALLPCTLAEAMTEDACA